MTPIDNASLVKTWALEAGFDRAGVAKIDRSLHGDAFARWLDSGHQAGMGYLERRIEHEVLRMPRGLEIELAEVFQLVDGHALHARQVQERVEQHRAVAGRQDEPVAVGSGRVRGVVFQELGEQHRRHVRGAHGQARMAGFGLFDGVHGEDAHGVRQIGMGDAIGGDGILHGEIHSLEGPATGRSVRKKAWAP